MRHQPQPRTAHSVPLVGILALLLILGGFIVAGPLLLRGAEETRHSVTELWLTYLRVRSAARGAAPGADSAAASPRELLAELAGAYRAIEKNRFFEIMRARNPEVEEWLRQIEGGIRARRILDTAGRYTVDHAATQRAFRNLDRFMQEHSRQQYRSLQTGIWSALVLLVGMAGILARLYFQNRRLATSLNTALEAKSQLIRETHHRVKNNLALVASLVNIKESSLEGEVDLSDLKRRISAVEHVHGMLSHSEAGLDIPMQEYLDNLMESVMSSVSLPDVEFDVSCDPMNLPAKKATAVGIIVNETVTNAVKHAFDHGGQKTVNVCLEQEPGAARAVLTVSNSGRPLPEGFDADDHTSLGMQLVSGLVEQLAGALEIRSEPETAFVVTFPVDPMTAESAG